MRCRYPWPPKVVCFVENCISFDQLNISRADIPCVLECDVEGATRSAQPVTLYITVKIVPETDFLFSLGRADEAIKLIVPINQSTTLEKAFEKINWVMDALNPIADVRVKPFCSPRLG